MFRDLVFRIVLYVALVGAGFAFSLACTPEQRGALAKSVPIIERGSCAIISAFTDDGTVQRVCATADDLAPLIDELTATSSEPLTSAEVEFRPAPKTPRKRKPARRHCAAWIYVDAGLTDASND